MEALIFFWAVV